MSNPEGLLSLDQLEQLVQAEEVDTVLVMFTDAYGRFVGKRFDAGFFVQSVAEKGSHACDYLLTVDMEMEPVAGYDFANWQSGYGDFHLDADLATLRRADWLENSAMVICDLRSEKTHELVRPGPRSLLRQQLEKADRLGFQACGASELEYYIFDHSYREAAGRDYRDLDRSGWYLEDYHMLQGARHEKLNATVRRHLRRSGVPVECSKGEWGIGQHELNVRYATGMEMADRHAIYKQCIKETADRLGICVTFMAKYAADGAGSSCHVHLSLWRDGKNAFAGSQQIGPIRCSDTFRHFLAGWITHVPDVMAFYGPTVNSYKRYQPGSWAPTCLAWCHDNRTAGFRVVGHDSSLRIECRIPGADCNPYLVFAAALASGIDGIENRLSPPDIFEGDVYVAQGLRHVPRSLHEATDLLQQSEFARRAFGDDVVKHYVHFFRTEQAAYDRAVTDWERRRYFERI